jgi:hypothetical protein
MDHSILAGLVIGSGLWSLFHYRKVQKKFYLILGILSILVAIALLAVDSLPAPRR